MPDDKYIEDLFNQSHLEGEDWLNPSEDILPQIEEAIYSKKERNAIPWLWIFGGLILSLFIILIISNKNPIHSNSTPLDSSSIRSEKNAIDKRTKPSNDIADFEISQKTERQITNSDGQSVVKEIKTEGAQTTKKVISENENILNSAHQHKENLSATNSKAEETIIQKASKEPKTTREKERSLIGLAPTNGLPELTPSPRYFPDDYSPAIEESITPVNKGNKTTLSIYTGYTNLRYELNENYKSALSAADFSHDNATGWTLGISIDKSLSAGLTIFGQTMIEKNTSYSGHNSSANYRIDTENTALQNSYDLTMASPLGFLNSTVLVQRASSTSTSEDVDINLDLHNRHTFYNVDIGLGVLQNIIRSKHIDFNIGTGLGINHIVGLKNYLDQVNIDLDNYNAIQNDVTLSQQNINHTRIYYGIIAEVNYQFKERTSIGVSYSRKKDFNSLFNNGDFNSIASRHQVCLKLSYLFSDF